MTKKKKIAIGIIVAIAVFLFCMARREHKIMDAKTVEKIAAEKILDTHYYKHTPGKLWNRTVDIKINRISIKLCKNRRIQIKDCEFDIFWQEGLLKKTWKPVLSGEGTLVQDKNKLFIENIVFENTDLFTNEYGINEKVRTFINTLAHGQRILVYEDDRLTKVKVRTDAKGIYAKLNW